MAAARTRLDFWFDAVLLLGFTLAYSYGFTGIAIHEWLGIGLGAALRRPSRPGLEPPRRRRAGPEQLAGAPLGAARHGHGVRVLVPGQHGGGAVAAGHVVRPGGPHGLVTVRLRPMDLGLTSMFNPVNLPSLRHAVVTEAGVGAAVVIIDFLRRKWRRARRAGC